MSVALYDIRHIEERKSDNRDSKIKIENSLNARHVPAAGLGGLEAVA